MLVLFSSDHVTDNCLKHHLDNSFKNGSILGLAVCFSLYSDHVQVHSLSKILFSVHLKKHCSVEACSSFIHLRSPVQSKARVILAWGFLWVLRVFSHCPGGGLAELNCPYVWKNVWTCVWCPAIAWHPIWGAFSCSVCSQERLRIHWDPQRDKVVTKDEGISKRSVLVSNLVIANCKWG